MQEGKATTAVPARFRLPRLGGLAGAGTVAVAIKLSSAALNFLMFVVAAMVTDVRSFGLFSTGFAAASLVSFVNVVGQQSIILRYWPQHAGAGNLPAAYAVLLRSILTVLIGLAAGTVVFVLASILPWADDSIPEWRQLCLSAALMAVMLGWSEFLSSVFRARDRLFAALLPRDIVWRLAVIVVLGVAWWLNGPLSAVAVTLLCAGLLGLCLLGQTVGIFADVLKAERAKLTPSEKAEFLKVTFGLWGVNAVPPALGQINTLIVAAILGAEIAGGVFVAERTARLIDLPLNGINQVLAPHISRNYYLNGAASVQHSAERRRHGELLDRARCHGCVRRRRHAVARPLRRGLCQHDDVDRAADFRPVVDARRRLRPDRAAAATDGPSGRAAQDIHARQRGGHSARRLGGVAVRADRRGGRDRAGVRGRESAAGARRYPVARHKPDDLRLVQGLEEEG